MRALAPLLSLIAALALAPVLRRRLESAGRLACNYRGRLLPCPFGFLVPVAALAGALPLVAIASLTGARLLHPEAAPIALYALGMVCLGAVDDEFAGAPRGLRGHAASTLRGRPTTGALKAAGAATLAPVALAWLGYSGARLLLASAVLVMSTNLFNLLDLRPGRAIKAFVALGILLLAVSRTMRPLWSLGGLLAPALVAGGYDLRERAMLGDTGSNLLGALAGLWLVLTVGTAGQLAALLALCLVSGYAEFSSLSALVERTPLLRGLDSLGRPS